jgi:hypothetical protein
LAVRKAYDNFKSVTVMRADVIVSFNIPPQGAKKFLEADSQDNFDRSEGFRF